MHMSVIIFSYAYFPSAYLLREVSVHIFCPIFHWIVCFFFFLLSFKSSLYIFDSNPLSDVLFANIISPSGLFFSFSLHWQSQSRSFLVLMKPSLSLISSMHGAFCIVSKKSSSNPRSSRFSPMLSSRNFRVLCFTLRSFIYFD